MSFTAELPHKLRNRLPEYRHILEQDGKFTTKDIADCPECPTDPQYGVKTLRQMGAVESCGKIRPENHNKKIHQYKWNEDMKEMLLEYREKQPKLPCGHRAHIHHHPEKDCFSCKYCEAETPEFDRQTVSDALNQQR